MVGESHHFPMTIDNFLNTFDLRDPYEILDVFEQKLAGFFGSKYAVLVDCCTHAIELSLRITPPDLIVIPKHTYVSIPMTAIKLNQNFKFTDMEWADYYHLGNNILCQLAFLLGGLCLLAFLLGGLCLLTFL